MTDSSSSETPTTGRSPFGSALPAGASPAIANITMESRPGGPPTLAPKHIILKRSSLSGISKGRTAIAGRLGRLGQGIAWEMFCSAPGWH
jgi:hypothetical protein